MMTILFDVSVPAISQHLKGIYADNALAREVTVKQCLIVQIEGEREIQRRVMDVDRLKDSGIKVCRSRVLRARNQARTTNPRASRFSQRPR
ncbi:MAG: hypothetical protein JNM52_07180 [Betaproteobacteria bacterium]|nr:hypothetical protein [Betaproteobacteria bacterium]